MGLKERRFRILLAEDSDDDVLLVREALEESGEGGRVDLVVARDGAEALDRLRAEPRPDFLILDLGLPRLDGWAVLKTKKEDPRLAPIPTIILTGDARPERIEAGFAEGTNAYLLKPVRGAPLAEALALLAREEERGR